VGGAPNGKVEQECSSVLVRALFFYSCSHHHMRTNSYMIPGLQCPGSADVDITTQN
jgi:hypothetical protein